MKKSISLIAMITSIVFFSCKEEKKVVKNDVPEISKNEFFTVELDVVNTLEDDFAVYYTEDNTINFGSDRTIWSGVKGQAESQKVSFKFSEEIIPTDIRLDFGMKKDQKEVVLENLKMDYYGKSFEIRGSDFLNYYRPNDSIKTEIDQAKGTIKFLQNPKRFNPIFYYPNEKLLEEISKITK